MPVFRVNVPITTTVPTVTVENALAVGSHRFQLEVVDSAGLRSVADQAVVAVQRIIIDPGPIVVNPGPIVVNPGPIVSGPIVTGPIVTGPIVTGPIVTGPIMTGPVITNPTVPTAPTGLGIVRPPSRPRTRGKKKKDQP